MNGPVAAPASTRLSRFANGPMRYLWIVGVVLYLGAITYVGWGDVAGAVSGIQFSFLALFIVVELAALGLRALKWRIALGPNANALQACFLSKGGGNLTPARLGEFAPLLTTTHRSARVGAWIIFDRVIEASATLVIGLAGLAVVLGVTQGSALALWSLLFLAALIGGLFLLSNRNVRLVLAGSAPAHTFRARMAALLETTGKELVSLRERAGILIVLTIAASLLDLVLGFVLFLSFGLTVGLAVLALAQLVHALTSTIPLAPNATGIPYAAAAVVLVEVAGVPLEIMAAVIGVRILLASGVFWACFLFAVNAQPRSPVASAEESA